MPFSCCQEEQHQVVLDYYGLNQSKLSEMFERRNKELLSTQFGGVAGLAGTVKSDISAGIAAKTEAERIRECGVNVLERRAPARLINFIIQGFADRTIQILSVAAVVSLILGMTVPNAHTGVVNLHEGWIEGVAIIVSVAIVVSVSSVNNYLKAKKFEELENTQTVKELQVLRDGTKATISSTNLVVGDVLYLTYGMELSVDALVITAEDLKINESAITGEPILIRKTRDGDPFLISGTSVEEGAGTALVLAVGMSSFQGRTKAAIDNADKKKPKDQSPAAAAVPGDAVSEVASAAPSPPAAPAAAAAEKEEDDEDGDATPLQRKLNRLAKHIGYFGLSFALLLFIGLVIKEVILITTQGKEAKATHFVNFVLIGIVLIVVAIPEGLPLAVTIGLGYAMKAMMADNCLVRILAACETMGAATTVCSDKTGTLTTNQMTCVQGVVGGQEFVINGYGLKPRHDAVAQLERSGFKLPGVADGVVTELSKALSLNSTAGEVMVDGQRVMRGNPTEKGLLTLVDLLEPGFYTRAREYYKGRLRHFPFNSTKKRMTTIVVEDDGTQRVYLKGDPEALMAACDRLVGPDGQVVEFTTEMRATMLEIQKDMAKQGNRTLGVAFTVTSNLSLTTETEPDVAYVLLGVLGIMDPPREEVPLAVKHCKSSGLIVRMVTGDSIHTAKSIASKCGIYEDNGYDLAMLGVEFCRMYNEEREHLRKLLPRLRVLARSSPTDKYCLVEMLKEDGEVVAVTGDGTNDAPALKLAHVGFAMQTGTDIAKGAADMVLLDDNFATVVTAIKWGRTVNDNVKKFLQFQMPINVTGVVFTLFGALYSKSSKEPFTPVQLLWLNLIMNPLAALAIATEAPEESALDRSPEYQAAPIVTRRMLSFVACHGLYQFVMLVLLLVLGHRWFDIVENPSVCGHVWPLVDDGTGQLVTHPTQEMCIRQCEYHGGTIGPGNLCQQGDTHSTMLFNTFALMQVFNVINARKVHGELNPLEGLWSRSRMLILIFALVAGLQAVVVEFGGTFISTVPLGGKLWGACIGIAAGELIVGILQRFIPVTDYVPEDVIARRARDEKVYFAATGRHLDGSVPVEVPEAAPEPPRTRSALVRRPNVPAAGLFTTETSPPVPPTAIKVPSTVFQPVAGSHSPPSMSLPTSPLGSPKAAPTAPTEPKRSRSALVRKKRTTTEPFQ